MGLRALCNARSPLCQDGGGIWGLTETLVATERQKNNNTFMMTPSKIMGNNEPALKFVDIYRFYKSTP